MGFGRKELEYGSDVKAKEEGVRPWHMTRATVWKTTSCVFNMVTPSPPPSSSHMSVGPLVPHSAWDTDDHIVIHSSRSATCLLSLEPAMVCLTLKHPPPPHGANPTDRPELHQSRSADRMTLNRDCRDTGRAHLRRVPLLQRPSRVAGAPFAKRHKDPSDFRAHT